MIQLGILVPLAVGGIIGAIWREYRKGQAYQLSLSVPTLEVDLDGSNEQEESKTLPQKAPRVFDDVGELHHYQRVSWYALAFAASGSWFYPPAALVSMPLLGYNAYHFMKIIQHSDTADQKAPLTIFEVIGVAASLATGRLITTSVVLLFSFGTRKLLLQAGNISNNIGLSRAFNPKFSRVWILRDGAEIETSISELQDGDIIVLHAGDTVAVKGKIVEGEGLIRQFSLRNQIKFVPKQEGDKVFPFTKVETGCLHIQPAR